MGRKKLYDPDVLIGKAMELFRDHGYAGTSTQMLVEELGVNRYSLYAEFGSKQELFDLALQRYDDEVIDRSFGPLERPGAGVAEIRALLEYYGDAGNGPAAGRGCFLCNTAVEFGPMDPSGGEFVQKYVARLSDAFRASLSRAKASGHLVSSADPRAEASFFTASVLGLFVLLRANASAEMVRSAAEVATNHLELLLAE